MDVYSLTSISCHLAKYMLYQIHGEGISAHSPTHRPPANPRPAQHLQSGFHRLAPVQLRKLLQTTTRQVQKLS